MVVRGDVAMAMTMSMAMAMAMLVTMVCLCVFLCEFRKVTGTLKEGPDHR